MAVSRFSNSTIANGFPKYQKFWDQTSALSISIDYLIVAGGGIGYNGGGGAGGLRQFSSVAVNAGTNYTITVGGGSVWVNGPSRVRGSNTTAFGTSTTGGGWGNGADDGGTGGSGGGGATGIGNLGGYTPSEGNNGYGAGSGGSAYSGGGGAGGQGGLPNGGIGATSALINAMGAATGTGELSGGNYYYAGGGAGCVAGVGGLGGGADGANYNAPSGDANTGGGGGGTYFGPNPGSGGSGIVILRTLGSIFAGATTGSPTRVFSGGYTYYTFTGNGSITF